MSQHSAGAITERLEQQEDPESVWFYFKRCESITSDLSSNIIIKTCTKDLVTVNQGRPAQSKKDTSSLRARCNLCYIEITLVGANSDTLLWDHIKLEHANYRQHCNYNNIAGNIKITNNNNNIQNLSQTNQSDASMRNNSNNQLQQQQQPIIANQTTATNYYNNHNSIKEDILQSSPNKQQSNMTQASTRNANHNHNNNNNDNSSMINNNNNNTNFGADGGGGGGGVGKNQNKIINSSYHKGTHQNATISAKDLRKNLELLDYSHDDYTNDSSLNTISSSKSLPNPSSSSISKNLISRLNQLSSPVARKLKFWNKKSFQVNQYDPSFKVIYLGNLGMQFWSKDESCLEKPLSTLWNNYLVNMKTEIVMRLTICNSGLKAITRQHGLTQYWSNRLVYCCSHKNYPRIFSWIYRHEGKKMRQELRCHAVLCPSPEKASKMVILLNQRIALALQEFRREKKSRGFSVSSNTSAKIQEKVPRTIPLRRQILEKGSANFRPPLERSKSAPKLTSILEEEDYDEEEDDEDELSEVDEFDFVESFGSKEGSDCDKEDDAQSQELADHDEDLQTRDIMNSWSNFVIK